VLVVVASIILSVASWGQDSVPTWATAVSIIASVLSQGLNLAEKYLTNDEAFSGSILEGVAGLWSDIKGPLGSMDFELNNHFFRSAAVFAKKVKDFTGTYIAPAFEGHIAQALKTVGGDLYGGWDDIKEQLSPIIDLPYLDNPTLKKIQDGIVAATSGSEGTEWAFRMAKERAEREVRGKILDVENNLDMYKMTRLASLY